MAVVYLCDATGEPIRGEPHERGIVLKRVYSDEAVGTIDQYLQRVHDLQEQLQREWQTQLDILRIEVLERYPDAKLPDIP